MLIKKLLLLNTTVDIMIIIVTIYSFLIHWKHLVSESN